jgi:hypothetical protein
MTTAGLQPQSPASLNAQIITEAQTLSPGLTANLPGSLIEDISSTDTGAAVLIDQARVDLVNSITPYGANAFLLNQLGQIYGVPLGLGSNTSVFVVFGGTPGYTVQPGFIVSDGLNPQYVVQDGGTVETSGFTQPLLAISNQPGTWAVPPNTVTQLITSVPGAVTLSVNNPQPGTPSLAPQTEEDYRAQVLQAGLASSQGMPTFLKSRLVALPGVQARLVSVRQVGTQWEVICGGAGDPFAIAGAIFRSMDNVAILTGSVMGVAGITNANPGVMTTTLNHGFTTGQVINVTGVVGMSGINGVPLTITVTGLKTFTIGINTTSLGTYVSGGVVTPNFRNITATVQDNPDTYTIPFVSPPLQTVRIDLTWNTNSPNLVSPATIATAGQTGLTNYVNTIVAGQPMNLFELQTVFQTAVAPQIPPQQLTRMVFNVFINGVLTPPDAGTGIIESDPESFFQVSAINITQG